MRLFLLVRDALIILAAAVLAGLAINGILSVVHFQAFNPVSSATKDLDFLDLYYTYKPKDEAPETEKVILINSGSLNNDSSESFRIDFLNLLDIVRSAQPACIGVDIEFNKTKQDAELNAEILTTAASCNECVFVVSADSNQKLIPATTLGFADLSSDSLQTVRTLTLYKSPQEISFAAAIARKVNPSIRLEDYVSDSDGTCYINFKHHPNEFDNILASTVGPAATEFPPFQAVEAHDLLNDSNNNALSLLKDRVIIIGHLGNVSNMFHGDTLPTVGNRFDSEDIHIVPHGHKDLVQRWPNCHGPVIHAEVVHMLLSENNKLVSLPSWLDYLIIILLMVIIISFYIILLQYNKGFKILALSIAVVLTITSTYFSVQLRHSGIYMNVGLINAMAFILIEFVEFYSEIATKSFEKWNIRSFLHL